MTKPTANPGSPVQRLGLHAIRAAEDAMFTVYGNHYQENDEAKGLGSAIDAIWPFFWEPVTYSCSDPEGKVYV